MRRISRGLPVGRGVYWGFREDSWELPAKREFLGTSVGRGETSGDQSVSLGMERINWGYGHKGPFLLPVNFSFSQKRSDG